MLQLRLNLSILKERPLAIKDDIDSIKRDLSAEEQFLENAIKGERFIKKYKKLFALAVAVAIIASIGYYANGYLEKLKSRAANAAYAKLIENPSDEAAKTELKNKDISLYALFAFKQSLENNDTQTLSALANEPIDPLLKEIIKSQIGDSGQILSNYQSILKSYELIKNDKIVEARAELKKIPLNSPLQPLVKNLEHYQGNTK
jgi:hypothetical protein